MEWHIRSAVLFRTKKQPEMGCCGLKVVAFVYLYGMITERNNLYVDKRGELYETIIL